MARATGAGVKLIVQPCTLGDRRAAMLQFPGGYIAEVHASVAQ